MSFGIYGIIVIFAIFILLLIINPNLGILLGADGRLLQIPSTLGISGVPPVRYAEA